jgi:hypothetical protein
MKTTPQGFPAKCGNSYGKNSLCDIKSSPIAILAMPIVRFDLAANLTPGRTS